MSLPSYPDRNLTPTREEAVNQIIASIAMEELGLSHIINAEGEKIQYALGTIPGMIAPDEPLTLEDLLKLNESVHKTLDSTMMNQFLLKEKLTGALASSVLVGPQGPRGLQGPATIIIDPVVENLDPGEPPYVNNDQGTPEDLVLKFGIPRGVQGINGAPGADGTTPTVVVAATETLEPGNDANVISAPTTDGIELTFQIPRGVPGIDGTVEISSVQAIMDIEDSIGVQILHNEIVPFNQLVNSSGTDIIFNQNTGTFSIDPTGINNVYLINWWVFSEGTGTVAPITFSLNVGTQSYLIYAPETAMQLSGTTLAVVSGNDPIEVSLTNVSNEIVSLSDIRVQGQLNIIGFK